MRTARILLGDACTLITGTAQSFDDRLLPGAIDSATCLLRGTQPKPTAFTGMIDCGGIRDGFQEVRLPPPLLPMSTTVAMYLSLAVAKSRATKQGRVDPAWRALHADAWPESVQKINNNIRNQFEIPVLFFVLVVVLDQLGAAGLPAQALAWLFVASRVAHAYVHTGPNYVPIRRPLFMFGCLMVLGLLVVATLAMFR